MVIKKFSEQFIGSSFPTRIETESGEQFILKMHGAGNGPVSLVSEFLPIGLLQNWAGQYLMPNGLPYPITFLGPLVQMNLMILYRKATVGIWVLPLFPIHNPYLRRDTSPLPYIAKSHLFTLDVFFNNVSSTSNSLNLLRDDPGKIWMTDHGSLGLFLGFSSNGCYLFKNHFFHHLPDVRELQYDKNINNEKLFESIIYENS